MLNQLILVGRLVNDPKLVETDNEKKVCNITLAVSRPYKNSNGEYETDFVDSVLWGNVAESVASYCKKGDMIGIRGRVQSRIIEKDDQKVKLTELVAEKATFLSLAKKPQDKENER